jgi:hypothetical protein
MTILWSNTLDLLHGQGGSLDVPELIAKTARTGGISVTGQPRYRWRTAKFHGEFLESALKTKLPLKSSQKSNMLRGVP